MISIPRGRPGTDSDDDGGNMVVSMKRGRSRGRGWPPMQLTVLVEVLDLGK